MSEFYEDGRVLAAITSRESRLIPLYRVRQVPGMTAETRWFLTQAEAKVYLAAVKELAAMGIYPGWLEKKTDEELFLLYGDAENDGDGDKTYEIGKVLTARGKTYEDYKEFMKAREAAA